MMQCPGHVFKLRIMHSRNNQSLFHQRSNFQNLISSSTQRLPPPTNIQTTYVCRSGLFEYVIPLGLNRNSNPRFDLPIENRGTSHCPPTSSTRLNSEVGTKLAFISLESEDKYIGITIAQLSTDTFDIRNLRIIIKLSNC